MTKRARPARVRHYIDADLLGFAKILVQVRTDVTYPGDPGGPVKGAAPDTARRTQKRDALASLPSR
jgi:hypothetical protein